MTTQPTLRTSPRISSPRRWARVAVVMGLAAALAVCASGLATPARADEVAPLLPRFTFTDRVVWGSVPAAATLTTVAGCREGEQLVGGGYSHLTPAYRGEQDLDAGRPPRYAVQASRPADDGRTWLVTLLNWTPGPILVTVHAECASATFPTEVVSAGGGADGKTEVRAQCPSGLEVTAGGWGVRTVAGPDPSFAVASSLPYRGDLAGWQVVASHGPAAEGNEGSIVTSYALCTAEVKRGAAVAVPVTAPSGGKAEATSGSVVASCAGGDALTGAGYRLDEPRTLVVPDLDPVNMVTAPLQWRLTVVALPYNAGSSVNPGGTGILMPVCVQVPRL